MTNEEAFIVIQYVAGRGTPLGYESGLLSNTQKWIVWGETRDDKAGGFIGKWGPGRESRRVREPRRTALPRGLKSQVLRQLGLASRLSLANHSDSGSFLVVQALFSQNGFQWAGFWEVVDMWCFLLTFPNSSSWWWLVSSCFGSTGLPKQFISEC